MGHRVSLLDQAAAMRAMAQEMIDEAQELLLEAHVLRLRAQWLTMGKEIGCGTNRDATE